MILIKVLFNLLEFTVQYVYKVMVIERGRLGRRDQLRHNSKFKGYKEKSRRCHAMVRRPIKILQFGGHHAFLQ